MYIFSGAASIWPSRGFRDGRRQSIAAWLMNTESEMGLIAPGNLADFSVLDRDYFSVPEDQIKSVSSVLTVMGGRVVFGAQDYICIRITPCRCGSLLSGRT
ncbi:amidohydrolase family protein [Phyllobacterium sp. CCNWLW109]|uniref:amidohydrolase family protein n=1 Tax=Phyllobacterium sp. CCNWLW109 TaxID=3127479 RepID=UPI003FCDAFEB